MRRYLKYVIIGIVAILIAIVAIRSKPIFKLILVKALSRKQFQTEQVETNIFTTTTLRKVKYAETVTADSIKVRYTPGSFVRKNIKYIEINGITITPAYTGKKINLPFTFDSIFIREGWVNLASQSKTSEIKIDSISLRNFTGSAGYVRNADKSIKTGLPVAIELASGEIGFPLKDKNVTIGNIKGNLVLVDTTVTIEKLTAELAGAKIEIKGKGANSTASGEIHTGELLLEKIVSGIKGYAKMDIVFTTNKNKISARGRAVLREINYDGKYIGNVNAILNLKNDNLKVQLNNWSLGQMSGSGTAEMGIKDSSYNLNLQGRNMDVSILGAKIKSSLNGNIEIRGKKKKFNSVIDLAGDISGVQLQSIHSEFSGTPEGIEISTFDVKHKGGSLQMFGSIKPSRCEITMSGRDIELSSLMPKISGETNFDFNISGETKEPAIAGSFYIKGLAADKIKGDYVSGNIRIMSLLKPEGEAEIDVVKLNLYDTELKNLKAKFSAESGKTNFDVAAEGSDAGLKFVGIGEGLSFTGKDFSFYAPNLRIENAGEMKFKLLASEKMNMPDKLEINNWGMLVNNALIYMDGSLSRTDVNMTFQGNKLDLHTLSDSVFGICDVNCGVKGAFLNPQLTFNSYVKDFAYRTLSADEMVFAGTYRNETFYIETGRLSRKGTNLVTLDGEIPITKTFKIAERPLRINLKLSDITNEFSYLYKDVLALEDCRMNGEFKLSGMPQKPNLYGDFGLSATSMKLLTVGINLEYPELTTTFEGDKIVVNSFKARTKSGGINVTGNLTMPDVVDLKIETRNLELEALEGISAKLSTSLALKGTTKKPELSGMITIKEAVIEELAKSSSSVNTKNLMDYDLVIDFPGKVWLKNLQLPPISAIDAEISGNVQVRKTGQEFFLAGSASVKDGFYYYVDRPFKITTGELKFTNSSDINPQINLLASTSVRYTHAKSDTLSGGAKDTVLTDTILIAVAGTLKEPQVTPSSVPAMPLEDIFSLLTFNMKASDIISLQSGRYTQAMGTKVTSSYLFRKIGVLDDIRNLTGMDVVRFEPELIGERSARFNVGKYVAKDLYLDYNSDIFALDKQEFRVEYTPWKVGTVVGQRKENVNSVGMKFIFRY